MVFRRKSDRERDRAIGIAWHQAAMITQASAGKLPSLESVLAKLKPIERQDTRTLVTMASQIATEYGLKLIKRARRRAS